MIDHPEVAEWETGRTGKPLDFSNLLFIKLATLLLKTHLGSMGRHRELQDLEDTLNPYLDDEYRADMEKAKDTRDRILKDGLSDGELTLIERKEAVDIHQRLWYSALRRLMKREGFDGETWIKG